MPWVVCGRYRNVDLSPPPPLFGFPRGQTYSAVIMFAMVQGGVRLPVLVWALDYSLDLSKRTRHVDDGVVAITSTIC